MNESYHVRVGAFSEHGYSFGGKSHLHRCGTWTTPTGFAKFARGPLGCVTGLISMSPWLCMYIQDTRTHTHLRVAGLIAYRSHCYVSLPFLCLFSPSQILKSSKRDTNRQKTSLLSMRPIRTSKRQRNEALLHCPTQTHSHIHRHTHTCTDTLTHTQTQPHIHRHTHIYTDTFTHTQI